MVIMPQSAFPVNQTENSMTLWAAGIEDEHLRRSFLEKVPAHRELVQEGERAGISGHQSELID